MRVLLILAVAAIPIVGCTSESAQYDRPGFKTKLMEEDGRLWVFEDGSKDWESFSAGTEPAKVVTLLRAGPDSLTLRGPEKKTLVEYTASIPGFTAVMPDEDRDMVWIFPAGSDELKSFLDGDEPAKNATRPMAGPMRLTLRALDNETIDAYIAAM